MKHFISSTLGVFLVVVGFVQDEPQLVVVALSLLAMSTSFIDTYDRTQLEAAEPPPPDHLTSTWEDIDGPALVAQMMSTDNVIDRLELEDEIDYRLNIKERPPEPEPDPNTFDWSKMKSDIGRKAAQMFAVPSHITATKIEEGTITDRKMRFQMMRHKANMDAGHTRAAFCDCGLCRRSVMPQTLRPCHDCGEVDGHGRGCIAY